MTTWLEFSLFLLGIAVASAQAPWPWRDTPESDEYYDDQQDDQLGWLGSQEGDFELQREKRQAIRRFGNLPNCGTQAPGLEPNHRVADFGRRRRRQVDDWDEEASPVGAAATASSGRWRIRGGANARAHSWPWIMGLTYWRTPFCGATLWQHNIAITAAHCLEDEGNSTLYVVAGDHSIPIDETGQQRVRVSAFLPHEGYDPVTVHNDIALLRLAVPIVPDRTKRPVCLPAARASPPAGTQCVIAGWGRLSHEGERSEILQDARVEVTNTRVCNQTYRGGITDNMICARDPNPRGEIDACRGDSGGPMVCRRNGAWTLMGITSFGRGPCGNRIFPGVYADVANLVPWIESAAARLLAM